MGVLTCDRYGCNNVMCDTHVLGIGHICKECQEEFKNFLTQKGIFVTTDEEIIWSLKSFMENRKGEFPLGNDEIVDAFFMKHTNIT